MSTGCGRSGARRYSRSMAEITTPLLIQLGAEEWDALERVRAEGFPNASLAAIARKLIRDDLVRQGVLPLTTANRSRGARRS
jgi:hypothetical protein